ncbi:MAG: succinyl-diaminopimelate desuccinylase [Deltaproteobacteria bacterium]|nr:succinyl-diaminopimelate desuccinylase [Deltaproteobacteria bacterium]
MKSVTALEQSLLSLCEISSFTGEEGPLCDHVEAALVKLLGRAVVARDGHSLVVTPACTQGPEVVLAGHFDVVRTTHEGPPRIEGDKIYGPGAADMKSGLAVMLELLREIAAGATPSVRPTFVFYEREEGPYAENRLGDLLDRFDSLRRAELAVCLEPSSNVLQLGCMGSLHGRVIFHGRTSHSARPWQGENAIHKSSGFLTRISALEPRDYHIEGLLYREVFSATMAQGGRGRNVVPDAFELNVNVRFAPGRTSEDAERDLRGLIGDDAELVVTDRSPSAMPARSHPLVETLANFAVAGLEPKQAWTDVARFALHGVAAVNLGPGTQSQAHQRDEWTDRAALAQGLSLFRAWMGLG